MLRGNWHGKVLGSGSDSWKYWDERRAGTITERDWLDIEAGIARSHGTCMTMGTASTMTAIAEAIGMTLPGASSIPAPDANHMRMAAASGRRVVEMVWEDLTPDRIQTRDAYENAIAVAMAMGCSTNAVIHVIAMARRAGTPIGLEDFDRVSRKVPVIANVRPSGTTYLMEDFFYAGGILALMNRMKQHLHLDALTVSGTTVGQNIDGAKVFNDDVIRPLDNPIYAEGALALLKGNLAPRRLRDQAVRLRAAPAEAHRPRDRVRRLSVDEEGRRSRGSRRDAGSRDGAAQRRPARRPGHARVGNAADPDEAREAGRARHDPHFGRAHVRHQLRRLRAARLAGSRSSAGRWRW